jgi:hypothetical protein
MTIFVQRVEKYNTAIGTISNLAMTIVGVGAWIVFDKRCHGSFLRPRLPPQGVKKTITRIETRVALESSGSMNSSRLLSAALFNVKN